MNADRLMRNMMQSMGMGMPFGGDLLDQFMPAGGRRPGNGSNRHDPFSALMMHTPGGFMNPMSMMMDPFQSMQQAMMMAQNGSNNNNEFSYCSSSVTTYTTDEHGRPQIYQQANEVKQGPNGLKETKSSLRDSRTGQQALEIGHHLRDKAHIKKKSKNIYTGEEEQTEDLVNLEENEAEAFEQNWMQQARNATAYNQLGPGGSYGPSARNNRLALTSGPSHDDQQPRYQTTPKHSLNLASKLFKKDKKKKKSSSSSREERHK
uniref:Myeloid leukemia factor 2 n=1 Tax=Aceria tosichella TaxID=561515 RepID=A0A6G1SFP7_9ACAR